MDGMLGRFEASLNELGIAAKVDPVAAVGTSFQRAEVHLIRGASRQGYAVFFGPAVTFKDAAGVSGGSLPTLVFTTFVAPKTAEAFRRARVQYLDTAGNAWVEFGDVLVDVRGHRLPVGARQRARTTAGNLFSTGRAQVTFALLAWPRLWEAPQRELAHAAGVSLGQAHNALTLLAESGYGPDRARPGQAELLDLWAAAFPTGLAKKLTLATYHGDIDTVKKVNADDRVFLSGEGAVDDLLRPATLTLYVEELDPRLPVVNRWRSDGPSNIVVRRKFWQAPDNGDAALAGVRSAPWQLVYADLMTGDDPRVRNVAKEWRDRHARPDRHS
jgi:hypothetical protein